MKLSEDLDREIKLEKVSLPFYHFLVKSYALNNISGSTQRNQAKNLINGSNKTNYTSR